MAQRCWKRAREQSQNRNNSVTGVTRFLLVHFAQRRILRSAAEALYRDEGRALRNLLGESIATVTATPNAAGAEPKSRAIRFYVKTFSIVNGAGSCWRVATN